jgi:Zn-dependent protease
VTVDWENMILLFVVLIISLTVHEAGHALLAKLGGDPTAYRAGQVTLNPLPHIQREPFGMVVLPLLSLFLTNGRSCIGFAHAPFDPYWAARHPKKAALMSAAGPLGNVLLASIAFAVLWFVGRPDSDTEEAVRKIADVFLRLNLLLAIFNLIPLPPLDGVGIVRGLYPRSGRMFDAIAAIPYFTLVVFVLMSSYLHLLWVPVYFTVRGWLPYPF